MNELQRTKQGDQWLHRCPVCWDRSAPDNGFISETTPWIHMADCPRKPKVADDEFVLETDEDVDIPNIDDDEDQQWVDLYPSSYEWECPVCGQYHFRASLPDFVTCTQCKRRFSVYPAAHVYDD